MSLFGLFSSDDSDTDEEPDVEHETPCNVSGHNWESKRSPGYYSHSRSGFTSGPYIKVKKKHHEECSKCGKYQSRDEWIGKIEIDEETDELTVKE